MKDKEMILKQYRQINREADDIRSLSGKIRNIEQNLSENWRGSETTNTFKMLEDISFNLKRINSDMIEFAHDYLKLSELKDE